VLVEEQRALLVIMITTGEALIDPVAFVKENHEALNIDDQHGQEIVSGLDFDVLIDRYGSLPKKSGDSKKSSVRCSENYTCKARLTTYP
jgi:hypothetical protein